MIRRVLAIFLIGLGVFGIVLAILLPTVAVPRSKKTPLDLNITLRSDGPGQLLDATTGQANTVNLRATRIVRTDSHASDSKYTTVNESLCTVIVQGDTPDCVPSSDPRLLSVTTDRVTTDRKSGESVTMPKYGGNVNGDTSVQRAGMAYKWPIDAKKQTYLFFSPDLKKAFPATYQGSSKLKGLTVYEYVCQTGTQPYTINGTFPGTYTDTRTVWVEPQTGAIIKGVEHQIQKLESGQVALDTTLTFDDPSITFQANYAKDKINQLRLAELWAPLGAGILGALLLAGGIFLLMRKRPGRTPAHSAESGRPEPGPPTEELQPAEGPPQEHPTQELYPGSSQT